MASQNPYLRQFGRLDRSSPQFPEQLTVLLDEKECRDRILSLPDRDVAWLVDYMDDVRTPFCIRTLFSKVGVDSRYPRS